MSVVVTIQREYMYVGEYVCMFIGVIYIQYIIDKSSGGVNGVCPSVVMRG